MDNQILKNIRLVVLDVDGVLTDGSIVMDENGVETKTFCVTDGTAIKWMLQSGLTVAIMSGRASGVVDRRCEELGIKWVYQKILKKGEKIVEAAAAAGVPLEQTVFVGDDLLDIPAMRKCGLAVAVADARDEVKAVADYVTETPGGRGAVREFAERLLKANGAWDTILERYQP